MTASIPATPGDYHCTACQNGLHTSCTIAEKWRRGDALCVCPRCTTNDYTEAAGPPVRRRTEAIPLGRHGYDWIPDDPSRFGNLADVGIRSDLVSGAMTASVLGEEPVGRASVTLLLAGAYDAQGGIPPRRPVKLGDA